MKFVEEYARSWPILSWEIEHVLVLCWTNDQFLLGDFIGRQSIGQHYRSSDIFLSSQTVVFCNWSGHIWCQYNWCSISWHRYHLLLSCIHSGSVLNVLHHDVFVFCRWYWHYNCFIFCVGCFQCYMKQCWTNDLFGILTIITRKYQKHKLSHAAEVCMACFILCSG